MRTVVHVTSEDACELIAEALAKRNPGRRYSVAVFTTIEPAERQSPARTGVRFEADEIPAPPETGKPQR